jgi:hypothetical protein
VLTPVRCDRDTISKEFATSVSRTRDERIWVPWDRSILAFIADSEIDLLKSGPDGLSYAQIRPNAGSYFQGHRETQIAGCTRILHRESVCKRAQSIPASALFREERRGRNTLCVFARVNPCPKEFLLYEQMGGL